MKKLFFLFLLVAVLAAVWTGRPGRDPGVALSPALDAPSGEVPAVAEQPGDAPLSEPESRTAPDESVQEAGEAPQDPHSADEEPRQAPEAVSEKAATTQIVTPEGDTVRKGTVERGDTVGGLLGSVGTGETQHYLRAARQVFSLRKFRAGQAYVVVTDAATGRVKRFEYEIDDRKRLVVEGLDDPVARLENIAYETRLCFVEGVIASDLFSAVADMGEGPQLALRIANLFAAEINFIRDLQEGDSFRVLVEKLYREGEYKGYGKVLAAAFTNRGKTFEAFLFRDGGGREGHFYNAAGESLRKTLLQAPLPITRVTSRFTNSRKHPILGYSRPHLGVHVCTPYTGFTVPIWASITARPRARPSWPWAAARCSRPGAPGGSAIRLSSGIIRIWNPCTTIFPVMPGASAAASACGRGRLSAMWAAPDFPPGRIWISVLSRTANSLIPLRL